MNPWSQAVEGELASAGSVVTAGVVCGFGGDVVPVRTFGRWVLPTSPGARYRVLEMLFGLSRSS